MVTPWTKVAWVGQGTVSISLLVRLCFTASWEGNFSWCSPAAGNIVKRTCICRMGLKQLHMLHTVSCKSQLQLLFGEKNTRSALLKCCHLRVCACVWKGFFTMRPHRHHPPWTPSSNPNQTSGCWLWGAVPTTAAQQLDLSIWSKCNCWSSYICCIHSCQICIIYIYIYILCNHSGTANPQPSTTTIILQPKKWHGIAFPSRIMWIII